MTKWYFDLLPKELNIIIICNLDSSSYQTPFRLFYSDSKMFQDILTEGTFWTNLVKIYFPKAKSKTVPSFLLDYGKKRINFYLALTNFNKLEEIYTKSIIRLKEFNSTYKYSLNNITNYKFLNFYYYYEVYHINGGDPESIVIAEKWFDIITKLPYTKNQLGYIQIETKNMNKKISYFMILHISGVGSVRASLKEKDAFDILLHIFSNGGVSMCIKRH